MNTKLISDCVTEALTSGMDERQLAMTMKSIGAHETEIDQAIRELRLARLWDCEQERVA